MEPLTHFNKTILQLVSMDRCVLSSTGPLLFQLLPWSVITRGWECNILYEWEPEMLMAYVRNRKSLFPSHSQPQMPPLSLHISLLKLPRVSRSHLLCLMLITAQKYF